MGGFKRSQIDATERTRRVERLGGVRDQGADIFCWCNRCGHNTVMSAATLILRLGAAFPVPEVGTRMRCQACGSRDVATRPAWPAPPPVTRHD